VKIIEHSFDHFDLYVIGEEFEERRENMLREFTDYKASDVKMYLHSLIDSIVKLYNAEEKHIDETLRSQFSMSDKQVFFYKQLLSQNYEKISKFKTNLLGKVLKSRIIDFSYNFSIRYAESNNEKVDFAIKLLFKYVNDSGNEDKLDIDLNINQFYSLFNEFQKIETMIKTLAN